MVNCVLLILIIMIRYIGSMNKGKSGFGLISIIIAIVIISILAGGGLYLREGQNQKSLLELGLQKARALKEKILQQPKEQLKSIGEESGSGKVWPTPKPVTVEPVTVEIDTSTWKTYRNEKYGFEFKHPSDWGEVQFSETNIDGKVNGDCATTGIRMYGHFSKSNLIIFGSHSEDYNECLGASITDFSKRFEVKGNEIELYGGGGADRKFVFKIIKIMTVPIAASVYIFKADSSGADNKVAIVRLKNNTKFRDLILDSRNLKDLEGLLSTLRVY